MICSPEETAFVNGWISRETLLASADRYGSSPYGKQLRAIADLKVHP